MLCIEDEGEEEGKAEGEEEGEAEEEEDEEDNLDEMVGAGLIHRLITGQPSASDKDICTNLTHIFNKIFKGYSLVNSGFKELVQYIDKTPLGHLGKILNDIYMSATT